MFSIACILGKQKHEPKQEGKKPVKRRRPQGLYWIVLSIFVLDFFSWFLGPWAVLFPPANYSRPVPTFTSCWRQGNHIRWHFYCIIKRRSGMSVVCGIPIMRAPYCMIFFRLWGVWPKACGYATGPQRQPQMPQGWPIFRPKQSCWGNWPVSVRPVLEKANQLFVIFFVFFGSWWLISREPQCQTMSFRQFHDWRIKALWPMDAGVICFCFFDCVTFSGT